MSEKEVRRIVREEMVAMIDALIPKLLDEVRSQVESRTCRLSY